MLDESIGFPIFGAIISLLIGQIRLYYLENNVYYYLTIYKYSDIVNSIELFNIHVKIGQHKGNNTIFSIYEDTLLNVHADITEIGKLKIKDKLIIKMIEEERYETSSDIFKIMINDYFNKNSKNITWKPI